MDTHLVKGHSIKVKVTKSAYDRKAVLYANNIIDELKKLGIPRDDVSIDTSILGNKNVPAVLEFWADGYYFRFSFSLAKRFIDNLYVISEVIRLEVALVLSGHKEIREFLEQFSETTNRKKISKELEEAKKILGLSEGESDLVNIDLAYKKLAKKLHPDMGGDIEEFQKINTAHKLIKKEMGI